MFLTAFDRGSFGAAAVELQTDPSTVSKAISRLEVDLGVQLFNRTTRQLHPTQAGRKYSVTARTVLSELLACGESLVIDNEQVAGTLKINLPVSYGRLYVMPFIQTFSKLYPTIKFDLTFSDAFLDVIGLGYDLSIRSGTVQDSGLIMRKISPIDFITCASPRYLEQYGTPKLGDDLFSHAWIRFRFKQSGKMLPVYVATDAGTQQIDPGNHYVVDDGEAMTALAEQHLGLTQAPHFILRESLLSGRLKPVMGLYSPDELGVFVLYPQRKNLPKRVRLFIDFILAETNKMGESSEQTWAPDLYK